MNKAEDKSINTLLIGAFIITSILANSIIWTPDTQVSLLEKTIGSIIMEICLAGFVFIMYAEKEYAKEHPEVYFQL